MLDEQLLVRCILYPRGFDQGELADQTLVAFGRTADKEEYEVRELSIGFHACFKSVEEIHNFGQRVAVEANKDLAARLQRALNDDEIQYYVGYYWVSSASIKSLQGKFNLIGVRWSKYDNLVEHGDIQMRRNPHDSDRKPRSRERDDLRNKLLRELIGPERFTYPATHPHAAVLNAISLPVYPPPRVVHQ